MDRRAHRLLDTVLILGALALGAGALVWIWQQRPAMSAANRRFTSPADVPRPWAASNWNDSLSFAPPPATPPAPPPHDPFQTTTTVQDGQLGVLMKRLGNPRSGIDDPFYGERAVSTSQPFVWRAGEAEIKLAALAVFRREARVEDHEASLQGLYRPDGTPLTSATLIATGAPQSIVRAREHFYQQEQTKLTLLFHARSFSGMQLLGLNVFDAQTSSGVTSGYSSSVSDDWFWLTIDSDVLCNRPLRIALTMAQFGTHTLEMEVRDGATLSHPLAALRLQGVAAIGPGDGRWSSWDFDGPNLFFYLHTPQPGNPSKATGPPMYALLLESAPSWGNGAFNLQAVDAQGRRMESRGGGTSNGVNTMQVEDKGSPPAKLIATVPERIVRIDFTLPGIPGMPELVGNDLLTQRVAAVRFTDGWQLQRFLQSYGQMELDLRGFGPVLTRPLEYHDVSIAELVEEFDRQMLASNPRLRCEVGPSPGAYKWSEPPPSRWQVLAETILRRMGLRP